MEGKGSDCMPDSTIVDPSILQNLKDAGCNAQMVEQFFQLQAEGRMENQLKLLSKQRNALLHKVHENQQKLDCLDYLIFRIKKQ